MSFAFKRFNFFQPHQIPRHGFPPNASCVVPGGPLLWVGTESGSVCVLDSRLSLIGSFSAHGHKVLEVLWLERRQLLVTVGAEEPGCSSTTVKLWLGERLVAAVAAAADSSGAGSRTGVGGGAAAVASTAVAAAGPNSPAGVAASMTSLKVTKLFGYHSGQQYPESPVTAAAAAEGGSGSGSGGGGLSGAVGSGSSGSVAGGGVEATATSLTVALGLASGSVVVLTGEVHAAPAGGGNPRAKLSHSRRLSARPDEGDLLSVTGLELTGTSDLLSLFVVTESETLCFHLQTNTKTVLDHQGSSATRCCCLRPGGSLLTVARSEGLYDYTVDTRAGMTVFEGIKQRLKSFGRYLVVVYRDDSPTTTSITASSNLLSGGVGVGLGLGLPGIGVPPLNVGGSAAAAAAAAAAAGTFGGPLPVVGGSSSNSSCLQFADVRTKLLAGTFVLQGLQHVFCAWGAVHAVTAAGAVWSYREIDLASQLEALLRRSLHKLALDVARSWGPGCADATTLSNIHQRWGDHLYSKGEYDAAMTQYLETVGELEPSYVIRRFLDAQRIHNLTAYLELMHERGLATCDHTTLLLNCYTKLKDVSKLDAFIRRGGVSKASPHPVQPPPGSSTPAATTTATTVCEGVPSPSDSRMRRPRRHLTSAAAVAAAEAAADGAAEADAATATAMAATAPTAATATATSEKGSGMAGNIGGRKQKQVEPQAGSTATATTATATASTTTSSSSAGLLFDPDTAIRVLRGAGYAEHALWVADAAGQIDSVLDILLDELGDADEAISYLEVLPRKRRAEALKKYGKALIGMRAEAATGLIMDLCCGPPPGSGTSSSSSNMCPPRHGTTAGGPSTGYYLSSVSDFAHLYSGEPTALMLLCEYILNTNAAVATAAHSGGDGGGRPGGGDGGGEDVSAVDRARSYERLLYHTLMELYLADHMWQQQQELSQQPRQQPTTTAGTTVALSTAATAAAAAAVTAAGTSPPSGGVAAAAAAPAAATAGDAHAQGHGRSHGPPMASVGDHNNHHHNHNSHNNNHNNHPQQQQHSVSVLPSGPSVAEGATSEGAMTLAPRGPPPPPPSPSAAAGGSLAGRPTSPDVEARRAKALDLLLRGWPPHVHLPDPSGGEEYAYGMYGPAYDPDHALVLCRLHGFRKGLLFLYDRLRLPREALQVYMSCGDHAGLISAVLKYGDASRGGDPVLWSEVLDYFVSQHDAGSPDSDCSAQIMQVLEHVERSGVLPPLVVLQALSRSRRLPLSLVRGYMARALQRDTADVANNREAVTRLAAETTALREEVTKLRTQPRLFQNSRCSASGAPLELPVAHFLCGHSFNLRQLGDNDRECPLCGPDQRRVAEIRHSMQAASLQPERFFAELRHAPDGFSVVAEHFGRGLMNVTPAAAAAAAAAASAAAAGSGLASAAGAGAGSQPGLLM